MSSCWQAHAASAILNFSENCTPEILTPYLDGIVQKLLVLLQVYVYLYWITFQFVLCIFVVLGSKQANFSCYFPEWQANGARGSIDSPSFSSRFITGNCSLGSRCIFLLFRMMDCCHVLRGCLIVLDHSNVLHLINLFICLSSLLLITSW